MGETPFNFRLYAQKKVMDLLARRDHSEKELRQKLRQSFKNSLRFRNQLRRKRGLEDEVLDETAVAEAVDQALAFATTHGWLGTPEKLAERMADVLHRKNKGIHYINHYLQNKGLPEIRGDQDFELEKALTLVKNKYSHVSKLPSQEKKKEQARVARFLASRGFDSETVRKVIYEKL